MAHKIIFNVEAKTPTLPDCVKLQPNQDYEDTILRDKNYNGESTTFVTITNLCNQGFNVPQVELFRNTTLGGNFQAILPAFNINANQTINVPVKYYGICKDTSNFKNYTISLNGSSANFKLNITQPKVNHPPVIQTIDITLENRTNKTFKLSDFTQYYSDADNDALDAVILSGDLSRYRLNGQTLTSPAEIPALDIKAGALVFLAPDRDEEFFIAVQLKVKDEGGAVSQ